MYWAASAFWKMLAAGTETIERVGRVVDRDRRRVVADRIGAAGVDEGGDRADGMAMPSVPTIGKAETASGPWVTIGGGVGARRSGPPGRS